MAKARTRTVKLDDVTVDPSVNPRRKIDPEHVAELADAVRGDKPVPPPVVFNVDGKLKLAEGFHRWEAYRTLKKLRIDVLVMSGTEDEWATMALCSNQGHGLKRTNDDKHAAVEKLIKRFPAWSIAKIVESAGVGPSLVKDVRRELKLSDTDSPTEREGKDGKTYTAAPRAKSGRRQVGRINQPDGTTDQTGESSQPTVTSSDADKSTESDSPATSEESVPTAAGENTPTGAPGPALFVGDQSESQPDFGPLGFDPDNPPKWAIQADTGFTGDTVPEAEADRYNREVESVCRDIDGINARLDVLGKHPLAYSLHVASTQSNLKNGRQTLWQGRPKHLCSYCSGDGKFSGKTCRACAGRGWVKKNVFDAGKTAIGAA